MSYLLHTVSYISYCELLSCAPEVLGKGLAVG